MYRKYLFLTETFTDTTFSALRVRRQKLFKPTKVYFEQMNNRVTHKQTVVLLCQTFRGVFLCYS